MNGKRKNTPDQIDQIMAQYDQKRKARRAQSTINQASAEIDEALSQLSHTPIPANVRQSIADALKQLRVAQSQLSIYVERLPPQEKK